MIQLSQLNDLYQLYGYTNVVIPACEVTTAKDETVKFVDQKNGLYALQSDPTLSIINMIKQRKLSPSQKVSYQSFTYRWENQSIIEDLQIGIEGFDSDILAHDVELITLAVKSLQSISKASIVTVGHFDFLRFMLSKLELEKDVYAQLIDALETKNSSRFLSSDMFLRLNQSKQSIISELFSLYGNPFDVIERIEKLSMSNPEILLECTPYIQALKKRFSYLSLYNVLDALLFDLTLMPNHTYYSGIIFKGYIKGCPSEVLIGGRYDTLISQSTQTSTAAGFAILVNKVTSIASLSTPMRAYKQVILEKNITEKGILYSENLRKQGFQVSLKSYVSEKDAILMAEAEGFEMAYFLERAHVKVVELRKNNVFTQPYHTFEGGISTRLTPLGIH